MNKLRLLDQYGRPFKSSRQEALVARIGALQRRYAAIKAKYDAAQTFSGNENHWYWADNLGPHEANSLSVRQKLRSRSRYEVIENNPYLKGILQAIANDFVGTGPRLKITDPRLSEARRNHIETAWKDWTAAVKFRQKLWRLRLDKITVGEGFLFAHTNTRLRTPVQLDFHVTEGDQVSSYDTFQYSKDQSYNEIDGVRFDNWDNPIAYYRLYSHPGGTPLQRMLNSTGMGEWIDAAYVVHWLRQERGWLRGIPEITTSLPLCALLRRYTLAVVRAAELAAEFSGVLESQLPPGATPWTDGSGNLLEDDPFDLIPVEMGMLTTMPWGMSLKQLKPEQPIVSYDEFVASLLREITRPLLVPYNRSAGTSKDSNMASSVVDDELYKNGQQAERLHCSEDVLDPVAYMWWQEYINVRDYRDDPTFQEADFVDANPSLRYSLPTHEWRWDRIGNDHTNPQTVANALATLSEHGFLTDRDIQERWYNRDYEVWQQEMRECLTFREEVGLPLTDTPTYTEEP